MIHLKQTRFVRFRLKTQVQQNRAKIYLNFSFIKRKLPVMRKITVAKIEKSFKCTDFKNT